MQIYTDDNMPLSVYPGGNISVSTRLENIGDAAHEAAVKQHLFLSADNTLDDDDTLLTTFEPIDQLASGEIFDASTQVSMPAETMSGDYQLIAVANPAQFLADKRGESPEPAEESFANNLASLAIEVELPRVARDICVGNPISTNSGRKLATEVDYRGTGSFPLTFARHYSSSPGNRAGWNTTYSRHLFIHDRKDGTTDIILVFDDGLRYEFEEIDTRGYSDPDVPGLMVRTDTGFAYLDEDGTIHDFDQAGRLIGLISQHGFAQTLVYENNQLVGITDHFGRQLEFDYYDNGLLAALHTPAGQTYRYEHNDDNLLAAVLLPDDTPNDDNDNPAREYLYESPHVRHGLTGIIDENGNRFGTFDYDDEGRATLTTHPGGAGQHKISYGENETTVTGPLGKETTYVFAEILGTQRLIRVDGRPTANCPAASKTKTYDARGFVSSETDAEGNVTEYTYTHTALPIDKYLYHVGLVTSRTEAVGTTEQRTTHTEYHPQFRLPVNITEPGRAIELTYDNNAQLIRREEMALDTGARRVWQYVYDDDGLLVRVDGPRTDVGDTIKLRYDEHGNVTAVVNPLGHTTEVLNHDANGLPLTVRDANGLITQLAYDAQRRLTAQTVESGAGDITTDIDYDANGNVIGIHLPEPAPDEDPGGQTLHYTYDAANRLIQIENDLGESIEFSLDADGNRITEVTKSANQNIVRNQQRTFDELSRLIETVGAAGQTTRFGYDRNDNLDAVQDALGRQTHLHFDTLNRLISITDALDGESRLRYDDRDNLTEVTDAEGVTTTYTYDGLNNLIEEDSTASGRTQHRYDQAGNRIETIDANGVVMTYEYDALNRLTHIRYPASPGENIGYRYDTGNNGIGRLTSIDDPSGNTTLAYDDRGNLVTDSHRINGITYTTHYRYNLANQLIGLTYPSGRLVHYQLNNLGRVIGITTQAASASPIEVVARDFNYLPPGSSPGASFGPATSWEHGNGLATRIGYDQDYRITDIDVADMDEILSLTYRYNDVANIIQVLDNLGLTDQAFEYDELDRLTSASGTYGDIDYSYDGVGNRLGRKIEQDTRSTNETYEYETGSHRIKRLTITDDTGTNTRQFAHDNNGNIVSDTSSERSLEMRVNARNRLAEVWIDSKRVGEYQYNALGQRVAKTSRYRGRLHAHFDQRNRNDESGPTQGGTATGRNNATGQGPETDARGKEQDDFHSHHDNKPVTERLHFHYDQAGNLIAESDNQGNVIREYIYLGNYRIAMTAQSLDSPSVIPRAPSVIPDARKDQNVIPDARQRDPGSGRRQVPDGQSLALYYIHNDHLGTAQKITDAQQRIVWSMEQTPFGEVTLTTEGIRMPMRFPGQYADIESGYSYNYFRDYDPSLGRYLQSDPIGLAGGYNSYGYVLQNPLFYVDRRGDIPVPVFTAGVGAIVGGIAGAIQAANNGSDIGAGIVRGLVVGGTTGFFAGIGFGAGAVSVSAQLTGSGLGSTAGSVIGGLIGNALTGLDVITQAQGAALGPDHTPGRTDCD